MTNAEAGAPGAIHVVLQNKGGVGKSFVALHLAQYFGDQGLPTAVFDSGPATPTLSSYQALQPRYFNFMNDCNQDLLLPSFARNGITSASVMSEPSARTTGCPVRKFPQAIISARRSAKNSDLL